MPAVPSRKKAFFYQVRNNMELLRSGKGYFDRLLEMIRNARHTIHLQVYILEDDETGQLVIGALKKAASAGIAVYVMVDGYASRSLPASFIEELEAAGIRFRFFSPVLKSPFLYFGRRLHHKIFVVDSSFALLGGINISNNYNDTIETRAWLDFAIYIEGIIAKELCVVCSKAWNNFKSEFPSFLCADPLSGTKETSYEYRVRILRNDWVRKKNDISKIYIEMLLHAKSHITIMSSYFLPGKAIRRHMALAVKRGVKVRVIAAGRSDVKISKNAERWLYDWLLRKGIELYEYEENVLHAKLAVCDDEWFTIGSYNLNNISAHASIELNLDVENPGFTKKLRTELESIIASGCKKITEEYQVKTANLFVRFNRWLSYQSVRFLIYIFTFYFKHRP